MIMQSKDEEEEKEGHVVNLLFVTLPWGEVVGVLYAVAVLFILRMIGV